MESIEPQRLKVFLCHASHDKSYVRTLYWQLIEEGFMPWLDEENLLAGQDWQTEIRKAVKRSDVVVICLSRHSVNKTGFFQREIAFALDAASEQPESAIFLIPARIEECDIPERIQHFQSPRIFETKGYGNLLSALRVRATSLGRSIDGRAGSSGDTGKKSNWSHFLSPAYALDAYFGEAFIETFWTLDRLTLKKTGTFTVSLIGETGSGKTSAAYVLAEAQFNFLGVTHNEDRGYCYRLPLGDNIYIVDHYSWEDSHWNEALLYMRTRSDLILFLTNPNQRVELQLERVPEVRDATNAPVVMVLNKIDTLVGISLNSLVSTIQNTTGRTPLPIAAAGGAGITNLRRFILKARQMYLSV
jgi:hypothetical protein